MMHILKLFVLSLLLLPFFAFADGNMINMHSVEGQRITLDEFKNQLIQSMDSGVGNKEIKIIGSAQDPRVLQMSGLAEDFGFRVQIVDVDHLSEIVEKVNAEESPAEHRSSMKAIKEWWHSKHVVLTPEEREAGLRDAKTIFLNKVIIGSVVWFSVGVDPVLASLLVISQSYVDYWWALNSRTMNNILSGRTIYDDPNAKTFFIREMMARQVVTFAFASLWRLMSTAGGAYGSVHLLTTLQGFFEVAWNSMMKVPANVFATSANKRLAPETYQKLGTTIFLISTFLSTADLAGLSFNAHTFYIDSLGHMPIIIKDSSIALGVFWVSMTSFVILSSEKFKKMVEFLHRKVEFYQEQEHRIFGVFGKAYNGAKQVVPTPVAQAIERTEDRLENFHSKLLQQNGFKYAPAGVLTCSGVLTN